MADRDARRGRRGPLVQVPGRARPAGVASTLSEPAGRLRPGAVRRHPGGLRRAEHRRRRRRSWRRAAAAGAPGARDARSRRTRPTSRPSRPRRTTCRRRRSRRGSTRRGSMRRGSTRPRIYAPRIYAPRIYAPRIYAPDSYVPDLESDAAFQRGLLRGAEPDPAGRLDEHRHATTRRSRRPPATPTASSTSASRATATRTSTPSSRVRDSSAPTTGRRCSATVSRASGRRARRWRRPRTDAEHGDRHRHQQARRSPRTSTGYTDLPGGARGPGRRHRRRGRRRRTAAPQVQALQAQAASTPDVPLRRQPGRRGDQGASSDAYRNDSSKYVVIAGGDDVVPFFRYPDISGLGQESRVLPADARRHRPRTPASRPTRCSARTPTARDTQVTIAAPACRCPTSAVGRLVEDPGRDHRRPSTHFLGLDRRHAADARQSSLVTGYDFLADAAHAGQRGVRRGPARATTPPTR